MHLTMKKGVARGNKDNDDEGNERDDGLNEGANDDERSGPDNYDDASC